MLKKIPLLFTIASLALSTFETQANTEAVVNLNIKHSVGGVDKFDRQKYLTLHSTLSDSDWNGEEDKLKYLMEDLDVYFGRDNGSPVWNINQAKEDPSRLGYADPEHTQQRGKERREEYYGISKAPLHNYDNRGSIMVGGQLHPYWFGTTNPCCDGESWKIDGGSGAGDFLGQFVNEFFRDEGLQPSEGHPRPAYVEILNEPLYELVSVGTVEPIEVFDFHKDAAIAFKKQNSDVKIGGYTAAFPLFEKNNFQRWHERMKLFIDTSGEYMDFYSLHFYDFGTESNPTGGRLFRGGRLEATLDMVDHYSLLKLGTVKEHVISEYGSINNDLSESPWSALRDWTYLRSFSPMMLQFMDRPDTMSKTIPFVPIKALWGTDDKGTPYPWRLLIQDKERPGGTSDEWVFSELIKLYELWSDVKGTRVDSFSTNDKFLIDSYVEANKAYVVISNLTNEAENIALHKLGVVENDIQSVKVKHLYFDGTNPQLDVSDSNIDLDNVHIAKEATIILEFTYTSDIKIDGSSAETKYFATEYLKPINANENNRFTIENVNKGEYGEALLRIAIGRDHGSSLTPKVTFNNVVLEGEIQLPEDLQSPRPRFFGMLEVAVPAELLKPSNQIDINFPDDGGHIASVNMKVFEFSDDIRVTEGPVTGITISAERDALAIGESIPLNVSLTPFFATNKSYKITSSDPSVAKVDEDGVVTGISVGDVTITAESVDGGFIASLVISVEEPVSASFSFDSQSNYTSQVYQSGGVLEVVTNFEAGTGFEVSDEFSGIDYFFRHLNADYGLAGPDIKVKDTSVIGKQRGISTVQIPLDNLVDSDDLGEGEFYFLFVRFKSTSGEVKSINASPIQVEKTEVIVAPFLALDDPSKYKNTIFTTDGSLDVIAEFEAGVGNSVSNKRNGVTFFLRELTSDYALVKDWIVNDESVVGKQSGTASASFSLSGLTPSSELPNGNFYFLFALFEASDGTTYKIPGVAPINIEQGVVAPSFSLDDVSKYKTTEYQVGESMDITANYEMGTGNTVGTKFNGIRYFLRHIKKGWEGIVKDVVVEDASVIGTQSGVSSVSLPLTGVTPSADLPEGDFYFLFVKVQSSDGSEYQVPVTGINISSAAAMKGDWDGDGDVDINDVRGLMAAIQKRESIDDAFDLNMDGKVDVLDARTMMTLCTQNRCAVL